MCRITQDALYELSLQHLVESSENWKLNVLKTRPRFESRGAATAAAALGCAPSVLRSADAALGSALA